MPAQPRPLSAATRREYAADWAFFADWCTAAGVDPLPAAAAAIAAFLKDMPAAPATQRRRLAAIDQHHRFRSLRPPERDAEARAAAGLPKPEPTSLAAGLSDRQFEQVLRRIPAHGWPGGLAGRRDRLLLVLTRAGLTGRQLQQLRTTDLSLAADDTGPVLQLCLGDGHQRDLLACADPVLCPQCIWLAWLRVLDVAGRYPGKRILRQAFDRTRPVTDTSPHYCSTPVDTAPSLPVLLAVDQNGYLAARRPISIRAISARRTDAALTRTTYRLKSAPEVEDQDDPVESVVDQDAALPDEFTEQSIRRPRDKIVADHRAALADRTRDHQRLADLEDVLDRLDDRVADLTRSIALASDNVF